MSRTLLLTLIISIFVHIAAAIYHGQQEVEQTKVAQGSIRAPISMTFSSVQQAAHQPEPEPFRDTPKPVEKKPKPIKKPEPKKNVVKIAEPEPQPEKPEVKKEPEPEKVVEKKPEPPKKEVEPQEEPPAETQVVKTATEKTEVEGLSNAPVFVSRPAIRKSVPPKYPRIAQRRNQQGVVMLEVVVDIEGHAMNIKVLESSGFKLLDQSAIAAVEDWEFEPQKRNNRLVASRVHIPVAFQLN
ncbi:energy transducer TonB [Endozoicomonas sp. 8E]|uniref:energy transducer TonB n=1 Tax=Endozoicomonas sp. 8E TaxID=3035692 RepID=UPI002938F168|nr:energy transducer TonB [Endozoicomonas sp. 8E]WOG27677.1 energy transducer TonB [Endozoicomonas sp. 8E]